MFTWTDTEVRSALRLASPQGESGVRYDGICTDSRRVTEGALFVALVGEHFDGHNFVEEAGEKGALGAVVSRTLSDDSRIDLYPSRDTLTALGDLAAHRRRALSARVVGITGSTGKTTTKEFTAAALSGSMATHATMGNLNNRVGVPTTLLAAPQDTEVVVLEMGSSLPGEIEELSRIASPEIGVITTVGEAHLDGFGAFSGVLDEKMALLRCLGSEGVGIIGDDPPELVTAARECCPTNLRVAGWTTWADGDLKPVEPAKIEGGCYRFDWRGSEVRLQVPGRHAVIDALLALTVAEALDVPPVHAVEGVNGVVPAKLRGETIRCGPLTLIVDCYNANPQSVRASVEILVSHPKPRIAFLGSMLELGEYSVALHRSVLVEVMESPLDLIVATGDFAAPAREFWERKQAGWDRLLAVPGPARGYEALKPGLDGGETILLKASRGVALERLLPFFRRDFGDAAGRGAD